MGITPNEESKQSLLDELLAQSEERLIKKDALRKEKSAAQMETERAVFETQTQEALQIERSIIAAELDGIKKMENELWIGAHIVCLPFFYDEYTIRAHVDSHLQQKYNQAIITTCGRFKAMGKQGIALVSPITNYIRNYTDYSVSDRKELEDVLVERVFQWLKGDVSLDSQPRQKTSHSLETIMKDIESAEYVIEQTDAQSNYMEGEVRLATMKALRHTDFLPPLVKYKLLGDLKTLGTEQIYDIGTFLLWEIRKSSFHHNKLLFYMLRIFKRLSDSLLETHP